MTKTSGGYGFRRRPIRKHEVVIQETLFDGFAELFVYAFRTILKSR